MKKLSQKSILMMCLLAGFTSVWADDAAKLKELERAMTAPSTDAPPQRKVRTRAIVFDNAPEGQQGAEQAPSGNQSAGAGRDCQALSPDVKAVAVDFAIQFDVGSARISSASTAVLNEIAKILALSPNRCILVEGHTDASGDAARNLALSRDRANSVVDYVSEVKGLDRKNLVAFGKGSSDPLKDLNPRDPKNRRVVFKVVSN